MHYSLISGHSVGFAAPIIILLPMVTTHGLIFLYIVPQCNHVQFSLTGSQSSCQLTQQSDMTLSGSRSNQKVGWAEGSLGAMTKRFWKGFVRMSLN